MSLKMSEEDKNLILDGVLRKEEVYSAKFYGVITEKYSILKTAVILTVGATLIGLKGPLGAAVIGGIAGGMASLKNKYSYIGLTNERIVFCVIHTFNCSKVKEVVEIELSKIQEVKTKSSLIPNTKIFEIYHDGKKTKLTLTSKVTGSNIKDQKENVEIFINKICK